MTIGVDNPFPGLRPFEARQADLFFGRDEQVEELLDRLERTRFLAVVGTSGSGKSSLMKAGLIPALRRGYFGGPDWEIAVFRPGTNPIAELATAVSGTYQVSRLEALSTLQRSSLGLMDLVRQHNRSGQTLLIVVDQFEELFRYRKETDERSGKEESAAFVKLLLTATGRSEVSLPDNGQAPIYVVLTMRSDFLGECSQFRGLPEALNNSQYLVPRMTRGQQREAIEGPISMAGGRITPQLVQRMLNDIGDDRDQLPVLQHALMRTWVQSRATREQGAPIDLADYESVGGMERALNEDADRALAELGHDPRREAIARQLFQCVVQSGTEDEETRRPTPVSEIVAVTETSEGEVRQVISIFERSGFLMLSEDVDPVVDISHESLIRLWRRLKGWVQEETESAQIYMRLSDSASKGLALYRDPELTQALRWRNWRSPNAAWARRYASDAVTFSRAMDFLNRSRNARARDRWIRRASVMGLCLLSIALGFAAFFAWKNSTEAVVRQIAAEAGLLFRDNDIETSTILAVEAMKRRSIPEYDQALRQYSALFPKQIASLAHNSLVNCVAFSPDGRYVVSGSNDSTARVLEVTTGKETLRLNHSGPVRALAVSRDGRYIATGSDDHVARVFDSSTGRELARVVFGYGVIAVQFSQDSRYLASSGEDWTARIVEIATGKEVARVNHNSRILALAFSLDGRYLASGSEDRTVRVTEVATGREISILAPKGSGRVMAKAAVAFTADAHQVIRSISDDVSVFETSSGKELSHIAQESVVFAVAFSPSSRLAATISRDGGIRLFEVLSGREVSRFLVQTNPWELFGALAFSPDERFVACGHGQVAQVFEIATGKERARVYPGGISALSFSPDSRFLATAGDDGVTRIFDVAHGDAIVLPQSGKIYAVALSRDGRFVAIADDATVCLFETILGEQVLRLVYPRPVRAVALGLDGRYLVTGGTDGVAHVFETTGAAEVSHFVHKASVDAVAISVDGRYVATGCDDHTARVFEAASGRSISSLAHADKVWAVAFSEDSSYLATGGFDGTVRIFETTKQREVMRLKPDPIKTFRQRLASPVVLVAFSPDGQYIVSAFWGGTVEAFEVASGRKIWGQSQERLSLQAFDWHRSEITFPFAIFAGGEDTIRSLSFSPDGRYVAIDSPDQTARVYETVTGRQVWRLNNENPVLAVSFIKQGKFLQTAAESSNVLSVAENPLPPDALIADVCSRVARNLTRDEWKLYVGNEGYRKTCPNLPEPPSRNR